MPKSQLELDAERARAATAPPSDADIRAELARERAERERLQVENATLLDAGRREWDRANQLQQQLTGNRPTAPAEDPFQTLTEGGVSLDAKQQRDLMDAGVRGRATQIVGDAMNELDRRNAARQFQTEARVALDLMKQQHPLVFKDEEGIGAAMYRARLRAERERLNLSPLGMLQLGVEIYNESRNPAGGAAAPYTESPSGQPGDPRMRQPEEPTEPTLFEKLYGTAPGEVVTDATPGWSLDKMTEEYLDRHNHELEREGFGSKIGQVIAQRREAAQRRAAAARAGGQ